MLYKKDRGHPKVGGRTYVYLQYSAVDVSYEKHIKKCTSIIDTLIQCTSYTYLAPHLNLSHGVGCLVPQRSPQSRGQNVRVPTV